MRLVLDTNVLVSALLSPLGTPARLLDQITADRACLLHDARILSEYNDVLRRPRLLLVPEAAALAPESVAALLKLIALLGEPIAARPLRLELPDPGDRAFIEVARTAGANALVTGNLRHFPAAIMGGIAVRSPAEMLAAWHR